MKKALRKRFGARKRLGPAPTTTSRHQPRTAHNAAAPAPDTPSPPHPRPPPRAPPQTPIVTTLHPRDPAETTQRPPPTTAAGGGQAGRHAGWPAGGQIGRGWRRTASGGRRSAVGTQARRRGGGRSGSPSKSHAVSSGTGGGRQAIGGMAAGGRRLAAAEAASQWSLGPLALQRPSTTPHATYPIRSPTCPPRNRQAAARKQRENANRGGQPGGRGAEVQVPVA